MKANYASLVGTPYASTDSGNGLFTHQTLITALFGKRDSSHEHPLLDKAFGNHSRILP